MKIPNSIICTIIICVTAITIFFLNKENSRYDYVGISSALIKVDRYTGNYQIFDGNGGWIETETSGNKLKGHALQ